MESHFGSNPPEYFQDEKYYKMGPWIDFPLIMNYRAKDQQSNRAEDYFYFLNGHNDVVYFSNSTYDDFESY